MSAPKVAIVAALERELSPVIKRWRSQEREYEGRRFRFFENDRAVVVCGGVGKAAARRAIEAVVSLYRPALVVSAGFAGSLDRSLPVGCAVPVGRLIDASDGSSLPLEGAGFTLITAAGIAGVRQKQALADGYAAQAVDMEASEVARGAQRHGLRFQAFKAISDEMDFELPAMQAFLTPDGRLQAGRFAVFALIRPWLWPNLARLAGNSKKASRTLCEWLDQYNHPEEKMESSAAGKHPMEGAL